MKKPVTLIIMDGFGLTKNISESAISEATAPNLFSYMKEYPFTSVKCSGMSVGLPEGQMGNSEVGHTNIGAGRVVYQELTRITKSIKDGDFFVNPELIKAINSCKTNNSSLHLMGLLSDGGVHSHNKHLYALLRLAKNEGLSKVYIHCFLDGRDVPPTSGADYIKELEAESNITGIGKIATVMGRYYAMDRDNRWERVQKAYDAMVLGIGEKDDSPYDAVLKSYKKGVTDEFVVPTVCANAKISDNDSVIFYNFRPDRAREITRTLVDNDFLGFTIENRLKNLCFICMTQYDARMPNVEVAYKPQSLKNTFGEYVSNLGLKQLRIAETEKYAHVTFFFNGGVEKPYEGEDRILVPSPKVATYDLKPAMSAIEVTEEVLKCIKSNKYDVIILNFANCDMVGHTGFMDAAKQAVSTVDSCVKQIVEEVKSIGGVTIITADHGNADKMVEDDNSPFTAHTTNDVPFIVTDKNVKLKDGGKLSDIAPSMLKLMGLPIPPEMESTGIIEL